MSASTLVIGGGHNGLVCATLLARAGQQVTLLEQRDVLGGLAAGEEFHPGFRSSGVHLDSSHVRAALVAELGLEQHGLRWREQEAAVFAPDAEGGPPVVLHPNDLGATAQALSQHSDSEALAFRRWCTDVERLGSFLRGVFDTAPPDVESRNWGALWELAKTGIALRRLGQQDMGELLRVGPMCVADWLNERFSLDRLKVLLALPAVAGTWTGPWSAGSALPLMVDRVTAGRSIQGGAPALIAALEAAAVAAGVTIQTGCTVERLLVVESEVRGVLLSDGTEIAASQVAATCDPKQALLDLVSPRDLPPVLERRGQAWRMRGTTAMVNIALSGPLVFKGCGGSSSAGGGLVERAVLGSDLDALERAFDPVKYGELPAAPCLDVSIPSVSAPGFAPDGQHAATIQVHFVPHALKGGWTEERRDELWDTVFSTLQRFTDNIGERVLHAEVLSPRDLEQRYKLTGGHVHHGELALDQFLHMRPNPECARYVTPLKGLILCGSGGHPGGGLTGMPGALGARALLSESQG